MSSEKAQSQKKEKLLDFSEKITKSKLIYTVLTLLLAMLAEDTLLTHQAIHNRKELRSISISSTIFLIVQRRQDRTTTPMKFDLACRSIYDLKGYDWISMRF